MTSKQDILSVYYSLDMEKRNGKSYVAQHALRNGVIDMVIRMLGVKSVIYA